jgi:hypothetical protein
MILAADYPFFSVLGSMCVFFLWLMWFWLLIVALSDVFTRADLSGWGKTGWTVLMLIVPLLGVLIYLLIHGASIGERRYARAQASQRRLDEHIRNVSATPNDPAAEIANAKQLLDSGAITDTEFAQMKQRALA